MVIYINNNDVLTFLVDEDDEEDFILLNVKSKKNPIDILFKCQKKLKYLKYIKSFNCCYVSRKYCYRNSSIAAIQSSVTATCSDWSRFARQLILTYI